ncbi:hypothetical protein QP794_15820 [Paenibacillus sp. UMB7766-LJ446]|uniref:hypothetical protein n=1 Tax=Paenibacillus sp. UMB7766-LJ446 TaxID=3046313 RepID=UPI00254E8F92|nr:hypothetical protein [Paenibacillus sp. UMB7766-LJ446]MDK8191555.1 hypothetical protein [Paenibacillus sp. UMB7766-LJ446]
MADTIKSLYSALMPTVSSSIYAPPTGKYAVVKSIVICNRSSSDVTISLGAAGIVIIHSHTLKENGTLIINDLDVPIIPGTIISASASSAVVALSIGGFERDYVPSEYPYVVAARSTPGSVTLNSGNDWIVKSFVITNTTSTESAVSITFDGMTLINLYKVKPYDSVILPLPKIFIKGGKVISSAHSGSIVHFGVILEKVVQ